MKITMERVAAAMALVIGSMAVVAGGQVLLGNMPDYYVIGWLPVYNFTAGVLTIFVTAVLLWRRHRYGRPVAVATFAAHAAVMGILFAAYRPVVAPDSLRAMTIRLIVWLLILGLQFFRRRVPEPRHVTV